MQTTVPELFEKLNYLISKSAFEMSLEVDLEDQPATSSSSTQPATSASSTQPSSQESQLEQIVAERSQLITEEAVKAEVMRTWRENGSTRVRILQKDKMLARNELVRRIRLEEESRFVSSEGSILFRL